MPTTTAHGALTAQIIATALRLNPGHEEDGAFRLKVIVWSPNDMTIQNWERITWWFKTQKEIYSADDGVVSIGILKKDHLKAMAETMALYGAKLLEVEP